MRRDGAIRAPETRQTKEKQGREADGRLINAHGRRDAAAQRGEPVKGWRSDRSGRVSETDTEDAAVRVWLLFGLLIDRQGGGAVFPVETMGDRAYFTVLGAKRDA
jgi:hypothetical protein